MPAGTRAGRPSNTDATAAPNGGHPTSIVVADDTSFVAHLGNAGRPHRRRQPTNTYRPDQDSRPQAKKGLDSRAHTGNADRALLAALSALLPRRRWAAFLVQARHALALAPPAPLSAPDYPRRGPGRPPTAHDRWHSALAARQAFSPLSLSSRRTKIAAIVSISLLDS